MGVWTADQGNTSVFHDMLEFDTSNHLASWEGISGVSDPSCTSTTALADTTNWEIVGYSWDGAVAGTCTYWWKVGAGAWTSEAISLARGTGTMTWGSGFRHVVGDDPSLGDDGNYDCVCIGAYKGALNSTQVQSLDMNSIGSWDAVFTGANAWLLGFNAIGTRVDRTGNGGDEVSRSAGITLQADPAGFSWAGAAAPYNPVPMLMRLGT